MGCNCCYRFTEKYEPGPMSPEELKALVDVILERWGKS